MSSSAPCSSHSLHVKVTQVGKPSGDKTGKNGIWSGKLIRARQAAQIDMMMYIHMYRCVYIEIYIYYVLCLYLYPYVCIDTCMLYSVQICMHPYVYMRGRQIIDYRPKNPRRMTRWRLQMQHCDESSSPECSNPLTGTPLFGKQFITLPKTGRANAPVKERKTGLPVPSIFGVPFFCLRDDKFSRKTAPETTPAACCDARARPA